MTLRDQLLLNNWYLCSDMDKPWALQHEIGEIITVMHWFRRSLSYLVMWYGLYGEFISEFLIAVSRSIKYWVGKWFLVRDNNLKLLYNDIIMDMTLRWTFPYAQWIARQLITCSDVLERYLFVLKSCLLWQPVIAIMT